MASLAPFNCLQSSGITVHLLSSAFGVILDKNGRRGGVRLVMIMRIIYLLITAVFFCLPFHMWMFNPFPFIPPPLFFNFRACRFTLPTVSSINYYTAHLSLALSNFITQKSPHHSHSCLHSFLKRADMISKSIDLEVHAVIQHNF